MSFSKRMGFVPKTKPLQIDSMDQDLRNSLWNSMMINIYNNVQPSFHHDTWFNEFREDLFVNFFKLRLNTVSENYGMIIRDIEGFYTACPWNRVYDLVEFFIGKDYIDSEPYIEDLNLILEREFSGYRIINSEVARISNELELTTINETLEFASNFTAFNAVNLHLTKALQDLSDRENPNYRNSIKESVSAVESIARIISKEGTLGNALNKLESTGLEINNQLKESFNKIYNYTNDKSSGIRHAVVEGHTPPDFETAKYILVTSSAFINYLAGLAQKSGIV